MPLWKERCMAKPVSTPSHKANECMWGRLTYGHTRKRLITHMKDKVLKAFVKREMHGQAQTLPCYKTCKHTSKVYTQETQNSNVFVKSKVHGQARTLPCHKSHEHTSRIYINTQDMKVWMLLWKERCMGKPETLPCHNTHKQIRIITITYKTRKFKCLCERRGAWASPKRSLVTRHTNK